MPERWQAIETAPKDGREIRLKRQGDDRTYRGRWYANTWLTEPWTWHMNPSHWKWAEIDVTEK